MKNTSHQASAFKGTNLAKVALYHAFIRMITRTGLECEEREM